MSGLGSVDGSQHSSFFENAEAEIASVEHAAVDVTREAAHSLFGDAPPVGPAIDRIATNASNAVTSTTTATAPLAAAADGAVDSVAAAFDPAQVQAKVAALQAVFAKPPGARLFGVNVLQQTLAVINSCHSSQELDAVISGAGGRSRLNLFLTEHLIDTATVQSAIDKIHASDATPGDWDAYNKYLDDVTGTKARPGNSVTLLDNGNKAFPQIFQAIDAAKSSVNVETFEFHDDSTGKAYAQHLIDAARRGVTVNVMMDEHGSKPYGGDDIAKLLRASGVNVIQSQTDMTVSKIDHRKVCVVDGQTGFAGGMNIGDSYAAAGEDPWHDMHAKLEGPAVADLQSAFLARWGQEGGAVKRSVNYFPPLAEQPADQTVRVIPHDGGQDEKIRAAYVRAIDTAQSQILIEDPYFVDSEVISHLAAAAKRGVDVRCVWPAPNDMAIEKTDAHRQMATLLAAGVKCYEYQPSMAHEKVCEIDGQFATIGSSNLDARSLENNNELNLVVTDPKFAGQLRSTILSDIQTKSARIYTPPAPTGIKEAVEDALLAHPAVEDEI